MDRDLLEREAPVHGQQDQQAAGSSTCRCAPERRMGREKRLDAGGGDGHRGAADAAVSQVHGARGARACRRACARAGGGQSPVGPLGRRGSPINNREKGVQEVDVGGGEGHSIVSASMPESGSTGVRRRCDSRTTSGSPPFSTRSREGQRWRTDITTTAEKGRGGGTSHKSPCRMLHSISTRKHPGSAVGGAVLLAEV